MALVSGGRSTLNPNAPLYIPAALRQVEDFSPEWWELITTSPWFHDYWLSQHQEAELYYNNNNNNNHHHNHPDSFDGVDVADLLPDDIDFGIEEDLAYMDSHTQGLTHPYVNPETRNLPAVKESKDLSFSAAKLAAEPHGQYLVKDGSICAVEL